MAFPPRFIEELRDRVSIVDTVARRVKLIGRGREHLGLCPFHNEKTPSFTVSEEKGFYHCFGCGAHGDAVSFVMETEGLSFPEAVERLADAAGLEMPRRDPAEVERARAEVGLIEAVEAASAFFEKQLRLPEGRAALEYLRGRGLGDAVIARHRLGFAPERRGALAAALAREGITQERLLEAGLLKRSEERDDAYEYFRRRIVFPITDRRGRVIAFGGRALGDAQPKYLNSPDTPIFHKGRVLYNHSHAREAARTAGELVVVEGYMDAIALDQAGIAHVVAPLGTALTGEQIGELWRMADEPVLCFDGDAAGGRAMARAAERALPLLAPGKSLRFAALPSGEDPDSLLRGSGPAAMQAVLSAARPLFEVVLANEAAQLRPDTPERRALLQKRLAERAASIGDTTVRSYYQNAFRARLSEIFPARHGRSGTAPRPAVPGPLPARRAALLAHRIRPQQAILAALVNHPDLIHEYGEEIAALPLAEVALDRLRSEILQVAASGSALDAPDLYAHLVRAGLGDCVAALLRPEVLAHAAWARTGAETERARAGLAHLLRRLQRAAAVRDLRERAGRVDDATAPEAMDYFVVAVGHGRTEGDGSA